MASHVLGVGATTLTYGGSSARSEVAWGSTGGGVSAYTTTPSYQSSAVPGMGIASHRNVADVAFNGDPSTGQYVAVISQRNPSVGWISAGGTSLSAPQWAGLITIANAIRAQGAMAPLGAPHALLYGPIASASGNYAGAFSDITRGSDGTCSACKAKTGYDDVSGLGSPNAATLLRLLESASVPVAVPVVATASVSGRAGTPLSFTATASAAHALTYMLGGAPAGMTVSNAGGVTWRTPVAGVYTVIVTATDAVTGLDGKGTYTVTITAH